MSIESVRSSNHLILSSPSPPAFNLSQHQGLFQWVSSSHQLAKVFGASASVFPMNIQDWFPLGLISAVQGTLSFLQHHSSKASVLIYVSELKWSDVTQSCPTLWDTMDCSLSGSSVHGILQVRILEWIIIPFPRGSSQLRDWTQVSCIAGRFFTVWSPREALQDSNA